jgi:phosphotriesterase-related protein
VAAERPEMTIQTVLGQIEPQSLGVTLPHEHLLLESPQTYTYNSQSNADLIDAPITLQNYRRMLRGVFYPRSALVLDDEQLAVEEVSKFKRAGGSTLIDLTAEGLGRNPAALKRISERSGVRIVMGAGFFIEPSHPERIRAATADKISEEIIRDLTVGVADTGIRAGVIGEIGVSPSGILPNEMVVLRAVALAHAKTKAAINVHTWGDLPEKRTQHQVIDLMEKEGVNLKKVALSHMEQVKVHGPIPVTDWEYVSELAERGLFICVDAFGQDWPWGATWSFETKNPVYMPSPTDFDRVRGIVQLIEKGQTDRILVSHDIWHKLRLQRYGGDGYDHLLTNVPQIFESLGVDERTVRKLTVDNPRRYLE